MPVMMDMFLDNKLGYKRPEQKRDYWNNVFEQSNGNTQVAQSLLEQQFVNPEFSQQDLGQTFSFDDGNYQPPEQTIKEQPTWLDNARSHDGWADGLINAGASMLSGQGLGGGLAAFTGTLDREEAQADERVFRDSQFDYQKERNGVADEQWGKSFQLQSAKHKLDTEKALIDIETKMFELDNAKGLAPLQKKQVMQQLAVQRQSLLDAQQKYKYNSQVNPYKVRQEEAKAKQEEWEAENPTHGTAASKPSLLQPSFIELKNGDKVKARPVAVNGSIVGWDTGTNRGVIPLEDVVSNNQLPSSRTLTPEPYLVETDAGRVKVTGVWDRELGQHVITHPELTGGKPVPITELQAKYPVINATSSQLGANTVKINDFNEKYRSPMKQAEQELRQLLRFEDAILGADAGARGQLNKVMGQWKALIDSTGAVTPDEIANLSGSEQAQSIVGALKDQVVGGGVMTEQDAQRVMQAFGDDPTGFFGSPQKTLMGVRRLMSDKYFDIHNKHQVYNEAAVANDRANYQFTDDRIGSWFSDYKPPSAFNTEEDYSKSGDALNSFKKYGLKTGRVYEGYRYIGGNPNQKSSWEAL